MGCTICNPLIVNNKKYLFIGKFKEFSYNSTKLRCWKEKLVKKRILKNIEWGILICCVVLLIIGCISLYSATRGKRL